MPLPISSLSQVCRSIANFVSTGLNASANSIRVMIGNPTDAVPGASGGEHHLNLFFYLVEPSGFFPDTNPGDTWWLRLQCLVTGFGIAEDSISAGENDLRLLGEVMRLFHETPVLDALQVENETFRLQVIFQALNPDDLNHIWSTQGDVSYRPSVAYEMSLAPVIPAQRRPGSPWVGAVGTQIRADITARRAPYEGEVLAPPVPLTVVDVSQEDWAPAIALIYQGQCAQSLAFAKDSDALQNFAPAVWVAGSVEGSPVRRLNALPCFGHSNSRSSHQTSPLESETSACEQTSPIAYTSSSIRTTATVTPPMSTLRAVPGGSSSTGKSA